MPCSATPWGTPNGPWSANCAIFATGGRIRRLLAVKGYLNNRFSTEEALKKAQIRGKKNGRTYIQASNIYGTTDIERILALIADYEEDFRSGLTDLQDTGLQLFLYDTVVKKGSSGTPT